MSLPANLPASILETILAGLASLFLAGANGNASAARDAALRMVAAYNPETEDELRLAANIVGFSFHALDALGQAAAPDLPLTRILRLRSSAVSLSRQSASAERRLAQVQKTRQQAIGAQPIRHEAEPTLPPLPIAAKANHLAAVQTEEHHQTETRIAASLKRAEARFSLLSTVATHAVGPENRPVARSP